MAFGHGSKARIYANGYDLSPYLRSVSLSEEADPAETTTFGAQAKTYIAGLKDAILSAEGIFDGAQEAVDEVLSAALGQKDSLLTWYPQGDALGQAGYGMAAQETSYEVESPVDDVVAITAEAQSRVGAERIVSLHALAARTTNGQGASYDNGAATNNGAVGYLQVTALTGTSPTLDVTIQHSADGITWSALVTFTQVTAPHRAQRVEVNGTVNRYVRATWAVGGTGPSATFNVALHRR